MRVSATKGATFPIKTNNINVTALLDTGASLSCFNHRLYKKIPAHNEIIPSKYGVVTASGDSLGPMGTFECSFTLGSRLYTHDFMVCRHLSREMILGLDFQSKNKTNISWDPLGYMHLALTPEISIQEIRYKVRQPMLLLNKDMAIPGRHAGLIALKTCLDSPPQVGELKSSILAERMDQNPNLYHYPAYYRKTENDTQLFPHVMINLGYDEICLQKGTPMVSIHHLEQEICGIITKEGKPHDSPFILSPGEIESYPKVPLESLEVPPQIQAAFEKLKTSKEDAFSKDSADIGQTTLVRMTIDTGDSPPICQRPYNLPLKHTEWVKQELDILEQAGVIERSISPWASPIVIVPKKSAPDEPPRR